MRDPLFSYRSHWQNSNVLSEEQICTLFYPFVLSIELKKNYISTERINVLSLYNSQDTLEDPVMHGFPVECVVDSTYCSW